MFFKANKIKEFLFCIIAAIVLLIFIEGLASTVLFTYRIFRTTIPVADPKYTKFDKKLGLTAKPNTYLKDFFGPGKDIKINSQSFRNNKDFTVEVPALKKRIICCGDSFTFGDGVGNNDTWCEKLTKIDNQLETVNIGLTGYGIDQAYLRYLKERKKLKHNVLIFAFILDDIKRMADYCEHRYPKPVLRLLKSKLFSDYTRIKHPEILLKTERFIELFDGSKIYELFRVLIKRLHLQQVIKPALSDKELKDVLLKVFESLQEINKSQNSILILVNLPTHYSDYEAGYFQIDAWRNWLYSETSKRNIIYFDLYEEFMKLPFSELISSFLTYDSHYSEYGNEVVAQAIYKRLKSKILLDKSN